MKRVLSGVVIVLALWFFPHSVLAVDYTIEEMAIDAYLQADGDVYVTENQTYMFTSPFEGITRTLIPKAGTVIRDVEAAEAGVDLPVEQAGNLYKIFRSGENETITVTVTYVIEGALTVYPDLVEFYWPFFDEGNESTYEQLTITVHPPEATTDVIAFGYDAAAGDAVISPSGVAAFNLGEVPHSKNGDVRVAYDRTLFPALTVTEAQALRTSLEAEQQRLATEREQFIFKQAQLQTRGTALVILLAVVLLALLIRMRQKKNAVTTEVMRRFPLPYVVPEQLMSLPATLAYMNNRAVPPEMLTAAVLDLQRKGYIRALAGGAYEVVDRNTDYAHETQLLDWLFDTVGTDGQFAVADVAHYTSCEDNQATYQTDFMAWQAAVEAEKQAYDLYDKQGAARITIGVLGLLIIPFVVFLGIYELYWLMTSGIVLAFGFLLIATLFKTRTVLGTRIKRDWTAFQTTYPERVGGEEWSDLTTDDQRRGFIYAIGVQDKPIAEAHARLLTLAPEQVTTATNPLSYVLFASLANPSFTEAEATTTAAGVAGSAGVGAGVGGGGGGSGAF